MNEHMSTQCMFHTVIYTILDEELGKIILLVDQVQELTDAATLVDNCKSSDIKALPYSCSLPFGFQPGVLVEGISCLAMAVGLWRVVLFYIQSLSAIEAYKVPN